MRTAVTTGAAPPDGARPSGPTQGTFDDSQQWTSRPWAATCISIAVRVIPIAVSALVTLLVAHRVLPHPHGLWVGAWVLTLLAVSQATVRITDRATRRLVPLTALLRFSLVFPDKAPSRFAVALRSGSVERMRRDSDHAVLHGLPDVPSEALATALMMVTSLNHHDRRTRGHCDRVRAFSELIAVEMGLDEPFRERLRWGSLLHDMGKLTVPVEILNKPGKPTAEEWKVLQSHPMNGEVMLAPLREWLGEAIHAAGQHHERWDGNGYPQGLKGDQISLSARIVAVADAYDVMTATRSYKKALPAAAARLELTKNAGSEFDPVVVRALLAVSVGRMTAAAAGPLGALVNLPFLGSILSSASSVSGAAASGVSAVAMTAMSMGAPAMVTWMGTGASVAADPSSVSVPVELAFADTGAFAVETTTPLDDGGSFVIVSVAVAPMAPVVSFGDGLAAAVLPPTTTSVVLPSTFSPPVVSEVAPPARIPATIAVTVAVTTPPTVVPPAADTEVPTVLAPTTLVVVAPVRVPVTVAVPVATTTTTTTTTTVAVASTTVPVTTAPPTTVAIASTTVPAVPADTTPAPPTVNTLPTLPTIPVLPTIPPLPTIPKGNGNGGGGGGRGGGGHRKR